MQRSVVQGLAVFRWLAWAWVTLVVAFSAGRAHPLVVRAMKLARHRGARTLSISDATLSDVGEHAELTLYYSSNSPSYSRSNAALLSVVQMPAGVPVACLAVGTAGAKNAAVLAAQILALSDDELAARLARHRSELAGGGG